MASEEKIKIWTMKNGGVNVDSGMSQVVLVSTHGFKYMV